jgi:hypothetical protein
MFVQMQLTKLIHKEEKSLQLNLKVARIHVSIKYATTILKRLQVTNRLYFLESTLQPFCADTGALTLESHIDLPLKSDAAGAIRATH